MGKTVSKTAVPDLTSRPTAFGVFLGVIVHLLGWFLLSTEMTSIALAFLTIGVILVYWSERWWPDVGRALAAAGVVLLVDDVVTEIFFRGPLVPGL